jgi:arsenate reductase
MAEGFGHEHSDGRFEIKSAGVTPIGVHPEAISIMAEAGVDISEQTSDFLTEDMIKWADYVVTLCNFALDSCPTIPPGVKHIHWDIDNPDRDYTSEEYRQSEFARVRDEIDIRVEELFDQIGD